MTGSNAWLASYPKSGNTWVRALVDALLSGDLPNLNQLGTEAQDRRVHLAMSLSGFAMNESLPVIRRRWLELAPESGFRLAKTHAAWRSGEDGYPTRWQPEGARAIYLVRDPRDVAVSWAHHLGCSQEVAVDIMRDGMPFNPDGLDPMSEMPSWSDHVSSWLDQVDMPTLVMSYEQLCEDSVSSLLTIADWLELKCTRADAELAAERCGFHQLVAQEAVTGFIEAASDQRSFFRRGIVGAWRDELEPQLVDRIEKEHAEVMARCGYAISDERLLGEGC